MEAQRRESYVISLPIPPGVRMASTMNTSGRDDSRSLEEGRDCADFSCRPRSGSPRITMLQKLAAEFLGTFMLVFGGCGSMVVNTKTNGGVTLVGVALAWGAIVTALVYTLGHVSGCHLNPAVTFALATVRKFQWALVPAYSLVQFLGAICGAFALRLLFGLEGHAGAVAPTGSNFQSFGVEFTITFILMFVIMSVCTDDRAVPQLGGAAIGAAVTVNALVAGLISGCSMNPARSLGPALASGYYKGFWVYMISPSLGALAGAWAYEMVRLPKSDFDDAQVDSGSVAKPKF